jgi:8-amino-7-oxononanoate synthase
MESKPVSSAAREAQEFADLFKKAYSYTRAKETQAAGYYPYFMPISASDANEVVIDGQTLVMAGSNNYLGYTHDKRVMEAADAAARRYGTGCTGSRFLNGTLDIHEKLERDLAEFCHKEACLVFSTGFQTNLGTISSLVGRDDVVITDKLDHASIVDGCRLSYGETRRFRHNDMRDLESVLSSLDPRRGRMVVVDGVFSMEGDMAPLTEIVPISKAHGARILVDEAHSVGILGETGIGASEAKGVLDDVDLLVGTFSKSFASIGGFVAGEESVIHYMKHHARSLIFSASMPPYAVATVQKCLDLIKSEPERRERVNRISERMRAEFRAMGYDTGDSETPIVPVIIGSLEATFVFWKRVFEEGVFTNPVVAPAVPESSSRIRTSYMATHTEENLDTILTAFKKVGRELGIIA